jgi:hypothetical protein
MTVGEGGTWYMWVVEMVNGTWGIEGGIWYMEIKNN